MLSIILGVVGAVLIGCGSFIAIQASRDGQTGMVTFPLWLLGGGAGITALILVFHWGATVADRAIVVAVSILAFGSVLWSFLAAAIDQRESKRKKASLPG